MQTRRTKRQQAETTRALLVEAAADLFAARGYDSTTVDDICRAAGRARGAFYVHFTSRADVFLAALSACDPPRPLLLLDALARASRGGEEAPALRSALAALVPDPDDLSALLDLGGSVQTAPVTPRERRAA